MSTTVTSKCYCLCWVMISLIGYSTYTHTRTQVNVRNVPYILYCALVLCYKIHRRGCRSFSIDVRFAPNGNRDPPLGTLYVQPALLISHCSDRSVPWPWFPPSDWMMVSWWHAHLISIGHLRPTAEWVPD